MATLFELKEHLRKGGKIKRSSWKEGEWIRLVNSAFVDEDGFDFPSLPVDAFDTDWEIYEEHKKTFKITHTGLYNTRDGRKVFVSSVDKSDSVYPICGVIEEGCTIKTWTRSGKFQITEENPEDIVAEWED